MDAAFIYMMVVGGLVTAGLSWIALHSLPRDKEKGDARSENKSERA